MEMRLGTKQRIRAFLTTLHGAKAMELETWGELRHILDSKEQFRTDLSAIHGDLWRKGWARLGLSGDVRSKEPGVVAKLSSLLVVLRSFAFLFTICTLIPSLVWYWRYTWIVPVLLILPLLHLYASRVLAGRLGDREKADAAHATAGAIALLFLALTYTYLRWVVGLEFTPMSIPGAWLLYACVLLLVLRARAGFGLVVWSAAVFVNAYILSQGLRVEMQALMTANAAFALFLLFLPRLAAGREATVDMAAFRHKAGFFLLVSLVQAAIALLRPALKLRMEDGLSGPFLAALLCLPFAADAARREFAAGQKTPYLGNLAASCVFILFANHRLDARGARFHFYNNRLEAADLVLLGWMFALLLSWSLWIFLVQRADVRNFNDAAFRAGASGLRVCFAGAVAALVAVGLPFPALLLGAGVLILIRRELGKMRALKAPWEEGANGGGDPPPPASRGE